jgi:hypothetical protein
MITANATSQATPAAAARIGVDEALAAKREAPSTGESLDSLS